MTKENKTLSQQICELCGVEARPRGCTNEDALNALEGYTNDCVGDCVDCTWYDPDEYYPNFENPENFVKLLELKVKHSSFCIDTFNYPKDKSFVKRTLEDIVILIGGFKDAEKGFIKAIRDYDGWVWG